MKAEDVTVSTVTVEEVDSSLGHAQAQAVGAASEAMGNSKKEYTVKETPVRSEKLKPVVKGSSDECRQVQDRMATYESLSIMRDNTLPELQVIGRFIESMPDRCKSVYKDSDKQNSILELQEQAVEQKVNLHCKSLINSIPMYKWLLQDNNLVDRGFNCYEEGIKRAIEDAKKSGKMRGKLLPMFKSRFGATDIDYTEYVFNQIVSQGENDVSTFSLKEYINFAEAYSKLLELIKNEDLAVLDHEEVVELASKIDKEPFNILVVEEYDDGERSPFEIKRFNTYTINSQKCSSKSSSRFNCVNIIGEGVCHYSPEISVLVLVLPILILFIAAIIIPILSQLIGTLSIPENCLDGMTYMIAPLAFIIGIVMPFVIEVLPSIIGFELPKGNMELMKNLHFVILIIVIFRISPLVGMVFFCIRANLYTEYLREKWFLIIVTIGGVLGNLSWLILGMLMEMSYSGTLIFESFTEAYKNVFWGVQPENSNMANVPIVSGDSGKTSEYFFEESNFLMLADLSIFISNSAIFMLQSLLLSQYVSDIL